MSPTGDLHVTMIFDREDVALGLPEHSYVLPQHGTLLGAAHPLGGQLDGSLFDRLILQWWRLEACRHVTCTCMLASSLSLSLSLFLSLPFSLSTYM